MISTVTKFGDYGQVALPLGVGVHALYKGHTKEGVALAISAALQQIVLEVLKYSTGVPRPFPHQHRLDSFPSGHTAGAFLAVGFILALDRSKPNSSINTFYKVAIIALAIIVGLSRYLSNHHFPIDIAVGGLLGISFGVLACYLPHLTLFSRERGFSHQ